MNTKTLYYICDGIGSVFDSQVLALLNAISKTKYFKDVYLFLGVRNENEKTDFLKRKSATELKTVFFKTYPNYPFLNFVNRKSISTALSNLKIDFKNIIFHTRGEMSAMHLNKILHKELHKNIVPDVRGASIEEISEFYDSNKLLKRLKITNSKNADKNLTKFEKISVVSNSLREYLTANYKINPEKLFVTPCLASSEFRFNESKRKHIRKELGITNDDILIVFTSGGTANWQNNEILITLADMGLKVLNLSKKVINHKNIINNFVDYSQIPAYLNAADAAIIWRDKSIVNKVASPVKFSEYVCSGLPVIANNSVDMISEYLFKYGCGMMIENLSEIDLRNIKILKQMDRRKISDTATLHFGIDIIVEKYLQIYSSVNDL